MSLAAQLQRHWQQAEAALRLEFAALQQNMESWSKSLEPLPREMIRLTNAQRDDASRIASNSDALVGLSTEVESLADAFDHSLATLNGPHKAHRELAHNCQVMTLLV